MEVPKQKAKRVRSPEEEVYQQLENLLINERIKTITYEILSYIPPRGANTYSYWNFYSPSNERRSYGLKPKTCNSYFIWARTGEEALKLLEKEVPGIIEYILRDYFLRLIRGDVQIAVNKGVSTYLLTGESVLDAIFSDEYLGYNLLILNFPDIIVLPRRREAISSSLKYWTLQPDEEETGLDGRFFLASSLSEAIILVSSSFPGDFISYLTGNPDVPREDLIRFIKEENILLPYREIKLVE